LSQNLFSYQGTEKSFLTKNEITNKVIGIYINLHEALRPGLLESAYVESTE